MSSEVKHPSVTAC